MFNRSYLQGHEDHPHYPTNSTLLSLQKTINLCPEEEGLLRIIRNLADPTKLRIYIILHKVKEISVADLTQILELSQSAVSHALADLKNLGLVKSQRCGQLICYSLKVNKKKDKFLNLFDKFK